MSPIKIQACFTDGGLQLSAYYPASSGEHIHMAEQDETRGASKSVLRSEKDRGLRLSLAVAAACGELPRTGRSFVIVVSGTSTLHQM